MRAAVFATLTVGADALRYISYLDQYHLEALPNRTLLSGITHVNMAFANSSLFTTSPGGEYTPFMNVSDVRAMFEQAVRVCISIGGWGDTIGFGIGATNDSTRGLFAQNVADTLNRLDLDCVDIDWEYPGGNSADYRQILNSEKVSEIESYPKLLQAIKSAIGPKELSIAVPGLARDMIAFTLQQAPKINAAVDFVNVMTYDLMNRRDTETHHHTSIKGSQTAISNYLALGFPANKLNLGFAFYAKWFTTNTTGVCCNGLGCPTALLEAADGSDTGKSGALTFEKKFLDPVPNNLTDSTSQCGAGTFLKCAESVGCCSQYGYCGSTAQYCGTGCQAGYGKCDGVSTTQSFTQALANGHYDADEGGQWWWDAVNNIFWSWGTADIFTKMFERIVRPSNLGGVFIYSQGEDSFDDYPHLRAVQKGVLGQ